MLQVASQDASKMDFETLKRVKMITKWKKYLTMIERFL
jgi:hypothetical protein